jgi:restriction system protein
MPKIANLPPYDAFMNPLLQALKLLGGSGTIEEINAKVIEAVGLSDEQLEVIHDPERGSQTEVEYRLAWVRTLLKRYGVIDNSSRGVWALTANGREIDQVNPQAVRRYMAAEQRKKIHVDGEKDELETVVEQLSWREELMNVLLKMDPSAQDGLRTSSQSTLRLPD